jgi:hypothetical protein
MCIIIAKPATIKLERKIYEDCFMRNPDGAGFSYVENNDLIIKKGFMKTDELIQAVQEKEDLDLVIHFRAASPGMDVNAKNCHPFKAESSVGSEDDGIRFKFAIVHNGRLDWRHTKDHSDTSCFVYDCLAPWLSCDPWLIERECTLTALRRLVCSSGYMMNKIVITRHDLVENKTKIVIINEEAGEWFDTGDKDNKVWFSNKTYKEPKGGWYKNGSFGSVGAGMGMEEYYDEYYSGGVKNAGYTGKRTPQGHIIESDVMFNKKVEKYKPFAIPDANGWAWSFVFDCWRNEKTGHKVDDLIGREPPYDVDWYKRTGYLCPIIKSKPVTEISKVKDKKPPVTTIDPQLALTTTTLEGGINITVPRDEDALLGHLSIAERGMLYSQSVKLMKLEGAPKTAIYKLTKIEKIAFLRSSIRLYASIHVDGFYDDEVDLWAVAKLKEGTLNAILSLCAAAADKTCTNGNC